MARQPAIQDGILQCPECGGPMVRVDSEFRCVEKVEPEEMVAVGFVPAMDSAGKLTFDYAKDQQKIQTSQAYSNSVEIDNAFLEKLGLNLDKIRQYQLKHGRVP